MAKVGVRTGSESTAAIEFRTLNDMAMEMRTDNPCDRVLRVLGPQHGIVRRIRALPYLNVAVGVETVRASGSTAPAVKLAFELLVPTALPI